MAVYNRTDSLPEEVASLEKDIQEYKSTQIVGNDNLIVYIFRASILSTVITAGTTGLFKATYTFDEASTAYVDRSFSFFTNSGGVFSYVDFEYNDPATVDDLTQKSWFYSINVDTTVDLFIRATARSTQTGSIALMRVS